MKTKLLLSFLLSFVFYLLSSQVPQGFNYQAIARDDVGNPIANTSMPVRITIQADSLGNTVLWQELHSSVSTNSFGMISLILGRGVKQTASTVATFNDIDWSITPKFIKTEIDYGGFKTMGVTRLWSVPYALRAKDTDQWTTSGTNIYRATGNVGIGTTSPLVQLDVNASSNYHFGVFYNTAGATSIGAFNNTFSVWQPLSINPGGQVWLPGPAVGIGTTSPAFRLDVVGRSRFQSGGGSAGFWLTNDANTENRSFIGMYNDDYVGFYGQPGAAWGMVMNVTNGNVGIGSLAPVNKLEVNGQSVINGNLIVANSIRGGGYSSGASLSGFNLEVGGASPTQTNAMATIYLHHHGAIAHQLRYTSGVLYLEGAGNGYGTNSTPTLQIGGGLNAAVNGGNVGIGTSSPTSKMVIQPPVTWDDNTPLFEVRNKYGVPIFAVYNNGVRILVEHSVTKGVKGGFAVGGYDMSKAGKTVDLMTISPDSIRFNINNHLGKGVKGGFAVGSFDASKGAINQDFMYLTPQTSSNGLYNTFLGYRSGFSNGSSANYNSFVGYQAGYLNVNGYSNVFIGYHAGYTNHGPIPLTAPSNGINNIYIGALAGEKNLGGNNVMIGDDAGKILTNGIKNVIIGSAAAQKATGNYNTYIGASAGKDETGSDNVCIGYGAGFGSGESGYLAIGNRSNAGLITGSFTNDKLYLWADVGIGTSAISSYKLYVAGNAWATGTWGSSDIRWKKNISDLEDAIGKIVQLNPVTYEWKRDEFPEIKFDSGTQIGLVAQEVEKIFPELVKTDDNGFKAIAYDKLSVVLIKGMKEQQKRIEKLEKLVEKLIEEKR